VREVDIPELLAALLKHYTANKEAYLFVTSTGRPLSTQRSSGVARHREEKRIAFFPAIPQQKRCGARVYRKSSQRCGSFTRRKP
jgi:hypothetical protein